MVMAIHPGPWTVDMLREFPRDGNRYELVDGVLLMTPAPRPHHELVRHRLLRWLHLYVASHAPEMGVFASESEITWGERKTYLQPDVYVTPEAELLGQWTDVRSLILTVEVLSPSSVEHDRVSKRPVYQRQNVGTYWIVDIEARTVEVWHPEDDAPRVERDVLRWQVRPDSPMLEIPLAEVFAGIPG